MDYNVEGNLSKLSPSEPKLKPHRLQLKVKHVTLYNITTTIAVIIIVIIVMNECYAEWKVA